MNSVVGALASIAPLQAKAGKIIRIFFGVGNDAGRAAVEEV